MCTFAEEWFNLQDENEEMGRELSEGRVHNLERQLALAKGYAEDLRAALQECEDHATALDEEAEKIQEEVCHMSVMLHASQGVLR